MESNFELIEILIVDDDQGDIDLTLEVLEVSKMKLNINVVKDGVECMNFLHKTGNYKNSPTPDLIFLDLNMPRKDGRVTLQEIKADADLRKIPVVILTTSNADVDIVGTYTSGANCYVKKPVGLEEFQQVLQAVENFWFTIVKLPTKV
ncbi:MAG: response regulator [Candidatus Cloacimonetes bacterium]|nr:response regulator [Candidatus Cloacimonadota bacterium]